MRSDGRTLRSGAGLLTLSVILVGGLNYLYSLTLTWLLRTVDYSLFATGQALLLLGATAASASAPWVLSQEIARARDDDARRAEAVSFAILAGLGQAVVAAAICGLITIRISSPAVALVVMISTFGIFGGSTVFGYLQGFERFRLIAGLRFGEVAVKLAAGLGLVAAGFGVGGALAGFGVASCGLIVLGLIMMGRDLRVRWAVLRRRRLWVAAVGLLSIQGGVAVLAGLDIVLASVLIAPGPDIASLQVSVILSRIPLFLSGALSMAVFQRLSVQSTASPRVMASALGLFLRVALPLAVITASIPPALMHMAFPADYSRATVLLPITTLAGLMLGTINIVTTFFQAEKRFRRCSLLIGIGILMDALLIVIGLKGGGIVGLAAGSAAGLTTTVVGLLWWAGRQWPGAVRRPRLTSLAWVLGAVPLPLLRAQPALWTVYALGLMGATGWMAFRKRSEDALGTDESDPGPGLRILHLAFEDHLRPGSGGGAIRTQEINRRLGARHRITVITTRYSGSRNRIEEGVHHVHIGLRLGHFGSMVTYFLALPFAIRRYPSDLVVEDFAAPVSTALVPLWTRRPVVGVAQWLFAREKSHQYHLPFFIFERLGVSLHRRLIAVSNELASQLREMNPRAQVDVIPNGVNHPTDGLTESAATRTGVVFLGRLELAQKGLDLLLEAYSLIAARTHHDLLIAGDGPDLDAARRLSRRLGVDNRVHFLGRLGGSAKTDLLKHAAIVCMPSRYETFGMVAIESLAWGTPVVAFDIRCLREVIPTGCGVLVSPLDTGELAEAMIDLLADPARRARMGVAGARMAARFDWNDLALSQEAVYLDAARAANGAEQRVAPVATVAGDL